MSQSTSSITKRIPKSLDTDTKLIGNYSLQDLVVAVAPAAAVMLLTRSVLPEVSVSGIQLQALSIPLAALAGGIGLVFIALTPTYVSSLTWASAVVSFHTSAADTDHDGAAEYTQVNRVLPEYDAIERTDGALVGALQVTPTSMALATADDWQDTATAFTDLLNTTIEFPIQIYSTTRPFPVDEYLAQYEARLDDPDVTANPTLQQLIERYLDWYRADLQSREMTIRDHYIIIPVRPESVRHTEQSLAQQLADLPYIGVLVDMASADTVAAERAAMATELDDRLHRTERAIRDLDDCSARRVATPALTDLVTDYWTTAEPQTSDRDTATTLRTTPLVGGPDR